MFYAYSDGLSCARKFSFKNIISFSKSKGVSINPIVLEDSLNKKKPLQAEAFFNKQDLLHVVCKTYFKVSTQWTMSIWIIAHFP